MENMKLGELIKEVRMSRKLTQGELAEGICSRRQLIRLEKNELEPSTHLMTRISQKLCFNFQQYYQDFIFCKSIKAFELRTHLLNAIADRDILEVRQTALKMESLEDFQSGENLQHLLYCKALVSSLLEGDFDASNAYCLQGIQIEDPSFSPNSIRVKNYSHISLTLLQCLGSNYMEIGNYELCIPIFEFMLRSVLRSPRAYRSIYRYDYFERNLYPFAAHALSSIYYAKNQYELSFHYSSDGIDFCVSENTLQYLPELSWQNFCTLCRLERYTEALPFYESACALYRLLDEPSYIKALEEDYRTLYLPNTERKTRLSCNSPLHYI